MPITLKKTLLATLPFVALLFIPPVVSSAQAEHCRRFDDRYERGRFDDHRFEHDFHYRHSRFGDRRFDRRYDRRFEDDDYYRRRGRFDDRRYYDTGRYYGSSVPPLLGLPNAIIGSTVPPLLDLPSQVYYGTTAPLLDALIPR